MSVTQRSHVPMRLISDDAPSTAHSRVRPTAEPNQLHTFNPLQSTPTTAARLFATIFATIFVYALAFCVCLAFNFLSPFLTLEHDHAAIDINRLTRHKFRIIAG